MHSPVHAALRMLEIDRLVLAIHDQSFPSYCTEDIGRGTPYGEGAFELIQFAHALGFTAIQLGPQGKTSRANPSPYDGAIFARSVLSLAVQPLTDDIRFEGILTRDEIQHILSSSQASDCSHTRRVDYPTSYNVAHVVLDRAYRRFNAVHSQAHTPLARMYERFLADRHNRLPAWFERDCIFEALTHIAGTDDWRAWNKNHKGMTDIDCRLYHCEETERNKSAQRIRKLKILRGDVIDRFCFGQFLLSMQHNALCEKLHALGMHLYGDMQVGFSHQDYWAWQSLFLPGYLLGAPPSRSNPEGQPWGYPVLNPSLLRAAESDGSKEGPALQLIRARAERMLEDYDGIRIDHPHGLVCPWVYRSDEADAFHAVRKGTRLNCAPECDDHKALAAYSIVSPEQLTANSATPRHADDFVKDLTSEQIDRFAVALDCVLDAARSHGRSTSDIMCEVLSTWPFPLRAVMTQRGLGRFCITQKADPGNPTDVYRSENTCAHDWIMIGTHDTEPLWSIVEKRSGSDWMRERASLLALHLEPDTAARSSFVSRCARNPAFFCQAMFAELFVSPARNVSVFFSDLFGLKETYNSPGTTGDHNWTLRLGSEFKKRYHERLSQGGALDMHAALSLALQSQRDRLGEDGQALARQLRRTSVLRGLLP